MKQAKPSAARQPQQAALAVLRKTQAQPSESREPRLAYAYAPLAEPRARSNVGGRYGFGACELGQWGPPQVLRVVGDARRHSHCGRRRSAAQ